LSKLNNRSETTKLSFNNFAGEKLLENGMKIKKNISIVDETLKINKDNPAPLTFKHKKKPGCPFFGQPGLHCKFW
jgi:hypothetical protein